MFKSYKVNSVFVKYFHFLDFSKLIQLGILSYIGYILYDLMEERSETFTVNDLKSFNHGLSLT